MKAYRALKASYRPEIVEREILRFTNAMVFFEAKGLGGKFAERQEAKDSDYHSWHETWESAHESLIEYFAKRVASAESRLAAERESLDKVAAMQKPEEFS
jgi:hypothetical protein